MRSPQTVSRVNRNNGTVRKLFAAAALATASMTASAQAGDVNWDNGSTNFIWDTSSLNWTGAAWNNASGNGAIFGATGAGAISVPGPININSLNFTANGYTLNGAGPLNIVAGTSTQSTGVVATQAGVTAQINVPINSTLGFQKVGTGTLILNGAGSSFGGGVDLNTGRSTLVADVFVGGSFGLLSGGFLKLGSAAAMPASTRVSIGNGYLDIGSNNVTVAQLNYTNQNASAASWNTTLNANNGVIGSGTLRVTGEINVLGAFGDNAGNSIASNLDLGGGTQIIRIGNGNSSNGNRGLMLNGVVSNGSLLKTWGYNPNGALTGSGTDGISLFNNNTYTGSTVLNAGFNVITGTNATTSIKMIGSAGLNGNSVNFMGANGSAQSATLLQAFDGGLIFLDNNSAAGSGFDSPNIPAAQNNDRIRDDAQVQLRYGSFTYRGLATAAATETYGSLNVLGGHNVVTITPSGTGGTAVLTAAGNLTMAPRSTMQVAGTTLGAAGKVFFNGTIPAADATGILPRIISANDFVTYSAVTGVTPLAAGSYSPTFTAGTNVSIAATTAVASSVNINALRTTTPAATTITIGAGQTLGITSGMIFNSGFSALTITGGVLDFGSSPGVMLNTGATTLSGAVTGSAGLIHARGTATYSGDFTGLTGAVDIYGGTANLNTNQMPSPINHRGGTLNINVSQTAAGLGAIRYGVPETDSNLMGLPASISISGAGANAIINRDLIAENGTTNVAGVALRYPLVPGLSVLSNTTGSQTWSGNVTLTTSLRVQGGGAAAASTGATNFTGNISGAGTFFVPNGRVNFSGNYSNAGGFYLGDQGFTVQANFLGTATGNNPVTISGGNSNTLSYNAGSLPTGLLRVWNSSVGTAPQIIPLQNSTINNPIFLDNSTYSGGAAAGSVNANVGAGIIAEWAGPISGGSTLTKSGTGDLILSSNSSTHAGDVVVSAGTLKVNGVLPSATVAVGNGATLGGNGSMSGLVSVQAGGTISPGNSVGTLGTGNFLDAGSMFAEIDMNNGGAPSADLLNVTGTVDISGSTLNLSLLNNSLLGTGVYLLVANDSADAVSGTFATISGLPANYTATVNYAYSGVDSLGRVGTGNDIAVTVVPEPTSIAVIGLVGVALAARRRRR